MPQRNISDLLEVDKIIEEQDSSPDGSPEGLIRKAFDGRKYRTLRDLRERTQLSKKRIRKVLKRIAKIKRRKWRISTFYLLAFDSEEFGQQMSSRIKPVVMTELYKKVIRTYQRYKFQRMDDLVKSTGLDELELAKALKMIGRKRSTKWRLLNYKKPLRHTHRGHKRIHRSN
ncbi:hypothetical protein KR032_001172 [Drosophila birchii]|nr:hypothetical protein KR032_001172 [Drosophila birchii]